MQALKAYAGWRTACAKAAAAAAMMAAALMSSATPALAQASLAPRDCQDAQRAFDQDDISRATREAESCIRRSSASQGYEVRARLRLRAGDVDGAENDLRLLTGRSSNVANYWGLLATVQLRRSDPGAALQSLDRALSLDPANADLLLARGRLRMDTGEANASQAALADFEAALRARPNFLDARSMRGQALALMGRCAEALGDLNEAVRATPADPFPLLYRGDCYARQDNYAAAIADYDRALQLKPDQASGYDSRATAKRLTRDPVGALADADMALQLAPNRIRAMNERGAALTDLGRLEDARAAFTSVLARDPANRFALRFRGSLNYNTRNFDQALADYRSYNQFVPNDAQVLAYEGDAARQLGLKEEAADAYRRALRVDPNQSVALKGLQELGMDI